MSSIVQLSLFDCQYCRMCHQLLPLSNFYWRNERRGYYRTECKSCLNEHRSRLYAQKRDEIVEKRRAYYGEKREEINKQRRQRRIENIEKALEAEKRQRSKEREKRLAYEAERYRRNPEPAKERSRLWRKNNPERDRHNSHVKRSRKRAATAKGSHTLLEWMAMRAWFGEVCLCCQKALPLTVDHVQPLKLGGSNSIDNLQPLCMSCNCSKRARHIDYRDPEQLRKFLDSLVH